MNSSLFEFIILLILVLLTSTIFVHSVSNNVTDQQALLSIKASITTDPLGVFNSWNNSIHFCQWQGVTCSRKRQRVKTLDLSSLQLVGTLSSHVGNLSFLRDINLDDNEFHGSIPIEIGQLFRIKYFSLGNNSFQGGLPANLSRWVDIFYIGMFGNNLEGELPTDFSFWSKLDTLYLHKNHISGSIPPSLGNISSLRFLCLDDNNLVGGIHLEVAKLEQLLLAGNNLSGTLETLHNMSSLYVVDVGDNDFEGTLPGDLGFILPNLQVFNAMTNRFSGPLPASIVNMSNLVNFDIPENNIIGPVPMNLGSISSLQYLNLGDNKLGDSQPLDDLSFFDSLANCTQLEELVLYGNGLRGKPPNSIVNLSTTIRILSMYGNNMYGSIPHEIGKLVNMTEFHWGTNLLTGVIPVSIGKLSKLGLLDLSDNNISGVIPTSIGNLTQLQSVGFDFNKLQGSIPNQLFNISTIRELYLTDSGLGGVIPDQIVGLSSHCVYLHLGKNLFTGPLPANIGRLKQMVLLDVSNNKLTGDIPATLGDCVMLEELRMERNLFEGRIPNSFKALKSLTVLDLSSNNISENIPSFLDQFRLIEFLNLSHNNFEGEVPKQGLFSNISAFTVVGNLRLCGGIQALQLHVCPVKNSRNKIMIFHRRMMLLLLLPLAILSSCLAFIFYRRRKSKQVNIPVQVIQDNQYPRVSYQDLQLATNEFSPNNLIGEGRYGSVYRGKLESEQFVAVKVLNIEVRGANTSFLAECEMLRNIRHRNLIKIITACSSTDFKGNDFKALVYEFMTNGSLDNWLHQSPPYQGNERNLTLLQRLNISIDVALGLDYLHHHSHTSIIHCDIKPSNILLDENCVARVGDFGLARFSSITTSTSNIKPAQTSLTGIPGTVGYVPPEYGIGGEISAEGDVYSYGILLLEMFSGKQPTSSCVLMDNCNNLRDYVKKALPHRVMDIVDPHITLDQEACGMIAEQSYSRDTMEVCLASIFEVGMLRSVETPRERIDISVALKQLHVARNKLLQRRQIPR